MEVTVFGVNGYPRHSNGQNGISGVVDFGMQDDSSLCRVIYSSQSVDFRLVFRGT